MKNISIILVLALAVAGITGCGPAANSNNAVLVNSNANRSNANSNGSTVGNAANSVGNTISNAVSSMTTDSPDDFMKEAAQGGMAEVELGKLAAQKAADPEVKKFGQMMVTDHGKANTELKTLAGKKNITLPADLGSHQSTLDRLKGLSGADFDKAYVSAMLDDHEADVKAFQSQADNSADADVKAFAAKTVPVLKKHLESIQKIDSRINQ
jgi:putative membrane protein